MLFVYQFQDLLNFVLNLRFVLEFASVFWQHYALVAKYNLS